MNSYERVKIVFKPASQYSHIVDYIFDICFCFACCGYFCGSVYYAELIRSGACRFVSIDGLFRYTDYFLVEWFFAKMWIKPNYLYSFGMLLSGFSMLIMISLPELHIQGIAVAGLVMGMSFGFFWSNRDYLVIVSTTDENRNYYYGVETFFNTLTFVVVPVIVGLFISNATDYSWIGNINKAYEFVIYVVMFLAIIASLIICRGDYEKPTSSKFVYLRFEPVWYKMLLVAWGKGLVQGFIVTAPTMLIMKLVGEEGGVGHRAKYQFVGYGFNDVCDRA